MGILQARVMEWIAMPSSRRFSQPRDQAQVSCIAGDSLPSEPPGKPKNTGVGSLSLLQGIFLTQKLNWGLLHCRQILYQLNYEGSPSPWPVTIKMARAHPHEQSYTCYPGTVPPTTELVKERAKKSGAINILPVHNYVTPHQALVLYHPMPKRQFFISMVLPGWENNLIDLQHSSVT